MSPSMPWHGVSENKKAGNFARSVLLHPVQRCYKFPILLHPSSSHLIPFISQTPYIYLTGFHQFLRWKLWLCFYSGLTKIRTRRRAVDSTHVTARRGNAVLVFVNSLYLPPCLDLCQSANRKKRRLPENRFPFSGSLFRWRGSRGLCLPRNGYKPFWRSSSISMPASR